MFRRTELDRSIYDRPEQLAEKVEYAQKMTVSFFKMLVEGV